VKDDSPLIIALVGPTAVGKSDAALALADRFPVSLISLDSASVYRGMDIGTAKPGPEVLQKHPHALIDIRDPVNAYSAAEYLEDADRAVREAFSSGRTPVLVGGTMLYLKTFREGLAPMPSADPATRERLVAQARDLGSAKLHERLVEIDPTAAAGIHPNNFSRIQRALEVYELSGRPISSFWSEGKDVFARLGARLMAFGVEPDSRQALHDRIGRRLDTMLEAGFVDEVARLKKRADLHADLPAIRSVGYRQIWEHLDGVTDEARMREKALAATRQLAKRQTTWMQSWSFLERIQWGSGEKLAAGIARRARLANP